MCLVVLLCLATFVFTFKGYLSIDFIKLQEYFLNFVSYFMHFSYLDYHQIISQSQYYYFKEYFMQARSYYFKLVLYLHLSIKKLQKNLRISQFHHFF